MKYGNEKKFIKNILITTLLVSITIFISILFFTKDKNQSYPWFFTEVNMQSISEKYTGKDVIVALIDTGIEQSLAGEYRDNIISPYNIAKDNTDINDLNGHGSSMFCLIVCEYEKNGIYGIAPDTLIMPIVVTDDIGNISEYNLSTAIVYAVDNGANIINISMGSRIESQLVKQATEYAFSNNVLIVSSVGDYQENQILYPAIYENTISVQAQSILGDSYINSSFGYEIDVLFPGEYIPTVSFSEDKNENQIISESGSSISTSLFSGIVALIYENSNLSLTEEILPNIRTYKRTKDETFLNVERFIEHCRKGVNYVK